VRYHQSGIGRRHTSHSCNTLLCSWRIRPLLGFNLHLHLIYHHLSQGSNHNVLHWSNLAHQSSKSSIRRLESLHCASMSISNPKSRSQSQLRSRHTTSCNCFWIRCLKNKVMYYILLDKTRPPAELTCTTPAKLKSSSIVSVSLKNAWMSFATGSENGMNSQLVIEMYFSIDYA
jgi:hypothetical protein